MCRYWRNVAALVTVLLLAPVAAPAQEQAKPAARQGDSRLDVDLGFVLERSEKTSEVGMLGEIQSGDRFHIRVRPRQVAYAYLFVTKGGQAFDLVLPVEGSARSARLDRNEWNTLPEKDALRFDKARGIEHLYLFVSSAPVEDIEELFENGRTADAVDETWLLDLRNKLDGEGTTTVTQTAALKRIAHRRRGSGPAVVIEELNVRHK